MTIVVFAIMLTERLVGERITQTSRRIVNRLVVSAAVLVAILAVFRREPATVPAAAGGRRRSPRAIGRAC